MVRSPRRYRRRPARPGHCACRALRSGSKALPSQRRAAPRPSCLGRLAGRPEAAPRYSFGQRSPVGHRAATAPRHPAEGPASPQHRARASSARWGRPHALEVEPSSAPKTECRPCGRRRARWCARMNLICGLGSARLRSGPRKQRQQAHAQQQQTKTYVPRHIPITSAAGALHRSIESRGLTLSVIGLRC